MGKSRSAPAAPDPAKTAAAQTGTNVSTAVAQQHLNNINQVTPYGNLTFDQTGTYEFEDPNSGNVYDLPTYTATQTLSESGQRAQDLNDQTQINLAQIGANQSGNIQDLLSKDINTANLTNRSDPSSLRTPDMQGLEDLAGNVTRSYGGDYSEDRKRVEDALFSRLNPQFDRDQRALDSRLAAQGIRIGSEAYDAAQGNLGRNKNDARMQAILAGGQEQSRLDDMASRRAAFENNAQAQLLGQGLQLGQTDFSNERIRNADMDAQRASQLNELINLRNQPINEISALLSNSQVQNPNFISPQVAQMPTTDIAGLINSNYKNQLDAYKSRQSGKNSMYGALGQIGAAYLGA